MIRLPFSGRFFLKITFYKGGGSQHTAYVTDSNC